MSEEEHEETKESSNNNPSEYFYFNTEIRPSALFHTNRAQMAMEGNILIFFRSYFILFFSFHHVHIMSHEWLALAGEIMF